MSSFTDPLIIIDEGGEDFTLAERFRYRVGGLNSNEIVDVPKGFRTNFASVPRIFWNIIPPDGKHGKAAVVHDYLYSTHGLFGRYSRQRCDEIFLEAMEVLGVGAIKRNIMFRAVRWFGKSAWDKCL